jgi:hypothetical protein
MYAVRSSYGRTGLLQGCKVSKNEIKIPWGSGIVGYVAKTGESCNVTDCYKDAR